MVTVSAKLDESLSGLRFSKLYKSSSFWFLCVLIDNELGKSNSTIFFEEVIDLRFFGSVREVSNKDCAGEVLLTFLLLHFLWHGFLLDFSWLFFDLDIHWLTRLLTFPILSLRLLKYIFADSHIYNNSPAFVIQSIELFNCLEAHVLFRELDEGKSSAAFLDSMLRYGYLYDVSILLAQFFQMLFINVDDKITDNYAIVLFLLRSCCLLLLL